MLFVATRTNPIPVPASCVCVLMCVLVVFLCSKAETHCVALLATYLCKQLVDIYVIEASDI